jgi:hypothetical protein
MVGLAPVVRILLGVVERPAYEFVDHRQVGGSLVGGHLDGTSAAAQRTLEEPSGGWNIAPVRKQHVDDLPELVDRGTGTSRRRQLVGMFRRRTSGRRRRRGTVGGVDQLGSERYKVTWSTSMPRSANNSSRSRCDRP